MTRMRKVTVSLPADILERIDAAVAARQTTRAGFLTQAALHELDGPDRVKISLALERGRAALAGGEAFSSEEVVRADRDRRDERDRSR